MIIALKDGGLTARIDTFGAKLVSLNRGGREYIWQNRRIYWPDRAGVLFPTCGRLYGGRITYRGKEYRMPLHGFALTSGFAVSGRTENSVTLTLTDGEETRAVYPFRFRLNVTYRLTDGGIDVRADVHNTGSDTLPFALGFHPWLNVPFDGVSRFTDCSVNFPHSEGAERCMMSGSVLDTGLREPVRGALRLGRPLFDNDAVMLRGAGDVAEICCGRTGGKLIIRTGNMPYIAFWQPARSRAGLLCAESMTALPGREGVTEDWDTRPDVTRIAAGGSVCAEMNIRIENGGCR